ncbi:MAG: hypothetical protein WBG36_09340 [Ornithinimicrobium sp.]
MAEIESLAELRDVEGRILERMDSFPNGGLLYLTHPLRLLDELGFPLSSRARTEFLQKEPWVASVSDAAFDRLLATQERQRNRARFRHLLDWEDR